MKLASTVRPNDAKGHAAQQIPLLTRLRAWWDGYELEASKPRQAPAQDSHVASSEEETDAAPTPKLERWTDKRIAIVQQVWGEGYCSPGGEEFVLKAVKPLGLNPALSLLDFGCGLGGAARSIVDKFGVCIAGFEVNATLTKIGRQMAKAANQDKRTKIHQYFPNKFEVKSKSYDCIISKEALFTIEDKDKLLAKFVDGIKDRGHLLIIDYMIDETKPKSKSLEAWIEGEPDQPFLWSIEQYTECLEKLGFEVHDLHDVTTALREDIVLAWANFLSAAKQKGFDDEESAALVDEVEIWTRRVQAIDSEELKIVRIHAQKRASTVKMLSDW